jgi:phospholipase C
MAKDPIVRTIASVQFPGVYLQMDGEGVTHTRPGQGILTIGHGGGPLDQFKIAPPPASGPYITTIQSAAYPDIYMRMDGTGLSPSKLNGGIVNKNKGVGAYEMFIIRKQPDDTVAIESQAFPGIFLRLVKALHPGPTAVVNCSFGVGENEKFRLETPPAVPRLRVLTFNTHLMEDSFIDYGTRARRLAKRTPYAVWEDHKRRDLIYRNILNSLADIVSVQEVWAPKWIERFMETLHPFYPHAIKGKEKMRIPPVISTSGLVLLSKFRLTHHFFKRFAGMKGEDALSQKGVLAAVANLPGDLGRLRVVTAHTTGEVHDIDYIAKQILANTPEIKSLPTITMGDFNIGWQKGADNPRYNAMKKIFLFPNGGISRATDSWIDVHGEELKPDPYTVEMRENRLHQLFSPERDTEPDTRLDYLWVHPGSTNAWAPTAVSVPRGDEWVYESPQWHWAHQNVAKRMPAAAVLGDKLLVVSKDGGDLGKSAGLMGAVFDGKTGMWSHYYSTFNTSAPPGLIVFKGKFHLFYRDPGKNANAIFHRSSSDGRNWSNHVNTGINTGGSVCPVEFGGKVHLLYVDQDRLGGQIFCQVKVTDNDNFGQGNWAPRDGIGINTTSDISAAEFKDQLYVFCKDNKNDTRGHSNVKWSILPKVGAKWQPGPPANLETSGSPGVVEFENRLHVYYRHDKGNAIYHASYDGKDWKERDQNTMHDSMINGVCPIVFQNKRWLFYPYLNTTGTAGGYYGDNMMIHAEIPTVKVDLSDHYPLLIDFAPATVFANVMVHEWGVGEVIFKENEWAGTRGEARMLSGFKLTSRQREDFTLEYMAHFQDSGDTEWKPDGTYLNKPGKRLEGFAIRLVGPGASKYELTYTAHVATKGDLSPFTKEGKYCGTTDEKLAVEAIYVKLERKTNKRKRK